jgi:hypothetical protein
MEDVEVEEDESELLKQDFPEISQSQEEEETGERALWGGFENEAEMGLQEVLGQFGFEDATVASTLAKSQRSVSITSDELPMKQEQDSARYSWMILLQTEASWRNLADIALRLESLLCNEAVTERTNANARSALKLRREPLNF